MSGWGKAEFDKFYAHSAERWGRPNTRPPITLGYHWFWIIAAQMGQRPHGLISPNFPRLLKEILNLNAGDKVLLFGSGFNGTGAGLESLGIQVVGTDISSYILTEKDNTEEEEVRQACLAVGIDPDNDKVIGPPGNVLFNPLNLFLEGGRSNPQLRGKGTILGEDVKSSSSKRAVKRALEGKPKVILTEEVLNSVSDDEGLQICEDLERFSWETQAPVVHMISPSRQKSRRYVQELNWKSFGEWRHKFKNEGFNHHAILPTVSGNDPVMGVVPAYGGLV